jgi:hypothetical protein
MEGLLAARDAIAAASWFAGALQKTDSKKAMQVKKVLLSWRQSQPASPCDGQQQLRHAHASH